MKIHRTISVFISLLLLIPFSVAAGQTAKRNNGHLSKANAGQVKITLVRWPYT